MTIYKVVDIAEECGVSSEAVRKQCKRMNVERIGRSFQIDDAIRLDLLKWFKREDSNLFANLSQPSPTDSANFDQPSPTLDNLPQQPANQDQPSPTDPANLRQPSPTDSTNQDQLSPTLLEALKEQLAIKDEQIAKQASLLAQAQETIGRLTASNEEMSRSLAKQLHSQAAIGLVEAEQKHLAIQPQELSNDKPNKNEMPSIFKRLIMAIKAERY